MGENQMKYIDKYHEIGKRMCEGEDMTKELMNEISERWDKKRAKCECCGTNELGEDHATANDGSVLCNKCCKEENLE